LKVLVTGAGGMVGRAVSAHCASVGDVVSAHDHASLDISDRAATLAVVQTEKPDVVINCAAWTDVDGCESDPQRAFAANAIGPENLARSSSELTIPFVTISTDYVFDGEKEGFYTQADQPNPQSVYATSKLEGEQRAQAAYEKTIVARTGFVFGPGGTNFLSRVIELARGGGRLLAINDAYGTPTYAIDLAVRLRELAAKNVPNVYHVVNGGAGASFEEFVVEALRLTGCEDRQIESVSMASLNRPAKRPRNSRLQCLYSGVIGLPPLRSWQTALAEFAQS